MTSRGMTWRLDEHTPQYTFSSRATARWREIAPPALRLRRGPLWSTRRQTGGPREQWMPAQNQKPWGTERRLRTQRA
eukprot:11170209-Lingulodinium_polyedra.AAC.1